MSNPISRHHNDLMSVVKWTPLNPWPRINMVNICSKLSKIGREKRSAKVIINFIQDVATPHNNALLKALEERNDVKLNIWYAYEKAPQYNWAQDFTNEIKKARIFGFNGINWRFVRYVLTHQDEKYFIIGWENHVIRFLIPLLWFLRRPYNMWFDYPNDNRPRSLVKSFFRTFYYFILKHSRSKVFCTGKMTVEYFINRGFRKNNIVNLSIYNEIEKDKKYYLNRKQEIYNKFGMQKNHFFITSGSRLIQEKGFDLLIEAINLLPDYIKLKCKILVVGRGVEKDNLLKLVKSYKLQKQFIFTDWMEIEDFRACIANSDLFIHPARFDAYGAGTLNAMIVGVPVIATLQSGSGPDRIVHNENGWLYDAQDISSLAILIEMCCNNLNRLKDIGKAARRTAEKHSPYQGAQIVTRGII